MIPVSRRWLLLAAFIAALILTGMFATRAFRHARRLSPQDRPPLQVWMNVPFIARGAKVPPRLLYEAIGLPPDSRDRRPIDVIAREQGADANTLLTRLQTAINNFHPPGAPPPPLAPQESAP